MRTRAGWLGCVVALALSASAQAYYLDSGRNFDVRLRTYAQLGIMMEDSAQTGCTPQWTLPDPITGKRKYLPHGDPRLCAPSYDFGDLGQERNFYNPEFDAKLTDYVQWMKGVPGLKAVAPNEFKFRFAWWGFYDGIYDYLNPEWNDRRRNMLARFSQSDDPGFEESYRFADERKNPRKIYAERNRINELYVDYTKGPVFLRIGRQAISWGEADTIALLDVSNPFDLTLGAPGFFEDVDEARIPLWTARSTVKLLDSWKDISSVFLDTYLVPGPIDTTVPIDPITAGVSPFNPDQSDPEFNLIYGPTLKPSSPQDTGLLATGAYNHTVVVSQLPENNWGNSRWGTRLTGVLFRDYTVQGWFFRTFNQAPVPLLSDVSAAARTLQAGKTNGYGLYLIDDRGSALAEGSCRVNGQPLKRPGRGGTIGQTGTTSSGRSCSWAAPVVTTLNRRLESVIGLSATWYSAPVDGIIRTEMEFFLDELAFIPKQNQNARTQVPEFVRVAQGDTRKYANTIPTANYLRFLVGYDKFFFMKALNPSNSFLLSTSFNGSINLSEDSSHDYRNPYTKPGKLQAESGPIQGTTCTGTASQRDAMCVRTVAHNFEDAYKFEGFLQTAFQTDYLHGTLQPRLVMIQDVSGIFAFAPSLTYRVTDNVILSGTYLAIAASRKANLGAFRSHDMLQLRVTAQLN